MKLNINSLDKYTTDSHKVKHKPKRIKDNTDNTDRNVNTNKNKNDKNRFKSRG